METLGVYVHLPFCERVCPYCDFAVVAARRLEPEREQRYLEALLAELARRRRAFEGRTLASIYLGGGTPSLFRPDSIALLVAALRQAFPSAGACEVTLEANPGTLERERLPGFRAAGVNRLSLGIQSTDEATLRRLGRAHGAEEAGRSLEAARAAGFPAISLDLILGAPGQTPAAAEGEIERALAWRPDHVSVYELTLEEGTPFARAAARGTLTLPDEDSVLAMLQTAEARLAAAGLRRYELSSYARPGCEAVHNQRYWQRQPVLGLGLGAVSNDPPEPGAPHGLRRSNTRDLAGYLARTAAGRSAESAEPERLSPATARGEAVFLALRRAEGLDAAGFAAEFGASPRDFWSGTIERLVAGGLLEEGRGGDLRLSPRGRWLADSVFQQFI